MEGIKLTLSRNRPAHSPTGSTVPAWYGLCGTHFGSWWQTQTPMGCQVVIYTDEANMHTHQGYCDKPPLKWASPGPGTGEGLESTTSSDFRQETTNLVYASKISASTNDHSKA